MDGMQHSNDFWKVCSALDNQKRLELLRYLIENGGNPCVGEIADALDISIPVTSLYLKRLRDVGLVTCTRYDRRIYYRALAVNTAGCKVVKAMKEFFLTSPDFQRIGELLTVTRALGHIRRNAYLRLTHELGVLGIDDTMRLLDMPPTTINRLFNMLNHAKLMDVNGNLTPPTSEPELTLFTLTLG